jgi:hypothetical protein
MSFKQEGHHHKLPDTHLLKNFYIVTMLSNPLRFKSRYNLFEDFKKHMHESGMGDNFIVIEVGFGDRKHQITEADNENHIQLQTHDELWHKENALNIAVSRLPSDWEYVAWIDADVKFLRQDWAIETVHQLQHHMVVQMWQTASALGPGYEVTNDTTIKSFGYCYAAGLPRPSWDNNGKPYPYEPYWHPGFAWAMRREAWDHLGGLLDICILGAADYHMANALIGRAKETLEWNDAQRKGYNPNYRNIILEWERRAEKYIKRDLGYVPGTLLHHWHGKGKDRKYNERWKALVEHNFDPLVDLKRDYQGLWQLNTEKWGLRDALRQYARDRNEDSIDTK